MADTDYVVLKQAEKQEQIDKALAEGAKVWVEIGTAPGAVNTEAIAKVTEGWTDEEKNGSYAAPSQRNFPVIPRALNTKVVDEFGAPSTAGTRTRRSTAKPPKDKEPAGAAA